MPKNAGPPAVEEEKKHNQRNAMVLNAALESSEAHAPMHFYNAQRRQYLENRNKAVQKRSEEEKEKFNSSLSKDLRGKFQRKKGVVHPISIRIDRFGRIAFNKNKELSQASYENCENKASPGGPKSSSSDREEQKNALPELNQANVQAARRNNNENRSL